MSNFPAPTSFINILVFVTPGDEPDTFNVQTQPEAPVITQTDTILNYQIFDSDGLDIVFTGMSVEPAHCDQLSRASVSVSGKQLTFSDANTETITLNVNLKFKELGAGVEFMHDPQISNHPPN